MVEIYLHEKLAQQRHQELVREANRSRLLKAAMLPRTTLFARLGAWVKVASRWFTRAGKAIREVQHVAHHNRNV